MSLCVKSILITSLLLVSSLLSNTENDLRVNVDPACDQANQRSISLRVENKTGVAVDSLRAEDLALFEDKTSREILKLESRSNGSLAVAVLIDTSVSQERSLPRTRLSAQKLVELILRTNKDQAAVISFTGEATLEQDFTNDLASLQAAISRVKFVPPPGYAGGGVIVGRMPPISNPQQMLAGSTAIWDVVLATTDEIRKSAAGSRRAMVLFTDGEDTSSKTKLSEAIEYASRNDVAVFAVGIGDQEFGGPNRDGLKKLAEETGGRAFFPKKAPEEPETLRQIVDELRSAYLLTYCSGGASVQKKPFKLKVQLTNPQARESDLLFYRRYAF
jgi:VWFA-related protein